LLLPELSPERCHVSRHHDAWRLELWRPLSAKLVLFQVLPPASYIRELPHSEAKTAWRHQQIGQIGCHASLQRIKDVARDANIGDYCKQSNGLTENNINGCMRIFGKLRLNIKDATLKRRSRLMGVASDRTICPIC
jgi:hypothetical protein